MVANTLSRFVQWLKRPRQAKKLKLWLQHEKQLISHSFSGEEEAEKRGTLIIKCDDIGDFMMWQQVIPVIAEHAEKPVYFVGNRVWKPLVETYFDFADHYVWIDKSKWGNENYRLEQYKKVQQFHAKIAFTPLFTRNYKMDDMLLLASKAYQRMAWDADHHAYFPEMKNPLSDVTTTTFHSNEKIRLEYFRNIEFIKLIYPQANIQQVFQALFPNFKKQNRLVVIPVANAASRCWSPDHFAEVINRVGNRFDSVILLGSGEAIPACEYIENKLRSPKIMNLAGQTNVTDMIPFIGESSLVLCPDTFALHVAVLTATDVIVLSNGTNWQRFTDYVDHVKSRIQVIYQSGFKPKRDSLKLVYSRSEINSITPSTVVEAIEHFTKNP